MIRIRLSANVCCGCSHIQCRQSPDGPPQIVDVDDIGVFAGEDGGGESPLAFFVEQRPDPRGHDHVGIDDLIVAACLFGDHRGFERAYQLPVALSVVEEELLHCCGPDVVFGFCFFQCAEVLPLRETHLKSAPGDENVMYSSFLAALSDYCVL